mmetsp:Transcript_8547/g.18634  ORF Transcript_8547/g.18634 Transcript_8547/m.18634 type:complete len:124 (+) Transcript_8547:1446-1817(+)|eukprot:6176343-Pleurochrysis_carterae.AAC.2
MAGAAVLRACVTSYAGAKMRMAVSLTAPLMTVRRTCARIAHNCGYSGTGFYSGDLAKIWHRFGEWVGRRGGRFDRLQEGCALAPSSVPGCCHGGRELSRSADPRASLRRRRASTELAPCFASA